MLRCPLGIRAALILASGIVWLGLGTSQAQTTTGNGYPWNYYSYPVTYRLPTYLTSINYPQTYGAYLYGIPPEAAIEGALPSPYAVAPVGFRSVYPPAVTSVFFTPFAEPVLRSEIAYLTVRVPSDAELWFEKVRMSQTGTERRFVSPPLPPGRSYVYDVRAVWSENGKEVVQNRRVRVWGGQRLSIDLTQPAPAEDETATLRTRTLP